MSRIKKLILFLVSCVLLGQLGLLYANENSQSNNASVSYAAEQQGEDTFRGNVPPINHIDVSHTTTLGGNDRIENLGKAVLTDKEVLRYKISNNDPQGFTVVLKSLNKGKMIRSGQGSDKEGDFLDYTVKTVEVDNLDQSSFLGCAEPSQPSGLSLADDHEIKFENGLQTATVDYTYQLLISAPTKTQLFRGEFLDTITVVLKDNS